MWPLTSEFKDELRAKANESLRRHFQRLEEEARNVEHDPPSTEMLNSFTTHLRSSTRILVLIGAGLSASSGLSTYLGSRAFWRTYSDQQLARKSAFEQDPILVWQFYNLRRSQAALAQPNRAHYALVNLASQKPGLFAVNQNVDGLCQRAGHPSSQIMDFHGSLFRVKCLDENCGYEADNYDVPIIPTLPLSDDSDTSASKPDIGIDDLPHCPKCKVNLLRPAVVWFGESIPQDREDQIDEWLQGHGSDSSIKAASAVDGEKVDLLLVIGTSASVYPAAGIITRARQQGARVAFFNMEVKAAGVAKPEDGDWSFVGDAAELVPLAFDAFLRECSIVKV